jgi:hypothetical protein
MMWFSVVGLMIGIEGRRNGALGYSLYSMTHILRRARQSIRSKSFGFSLPSYVGENFARSSLGRVEACGCRLTRLPLHCAAGAACQTLLDARLW